IEPGISVARHTHPGMEAAYILEGSFELPIHGQPTRMVKAGDAFHIPPETPHAGGKPSDVKVRVLSTYVVEKGKPLASPACTLLRQAKAGMGRARARGRPIAADHTGAVVCAPGCRSGCSSAKASICMQASWMRRAVG